MKGLFFVILFTLILFIPDVVFGASYTINMPVGSASPDAPYFWQNEKSGLTTGDIEIIVGDTIVWKNGDRAKHTITSGTNENGHDGVFGGNSFLVPGQSYDFKFNKIGQYPYFCLIHPWMTGTVFVVDESKIIPNVGKTVGDGSVSFDVKYQFDGALSLVQVNETEKSIVLEISQNTVPDNKVLKIYLPTELIDGPFIVLLDDEIISEFEIFKENDLNGISVFINENSKFLKIVGTTIVPEFDLLYFPTFAIGVVGVLVIWFKSQKSLILKTKT